jgi:hypothetical protein
VTRQTPPERRPCRYKYSRARWRRPRAFARGALEVPAGPPACCKGPGGGFEDPGEARPIELRQEGQYCLAMRAHPSKGLPRTSGSYRRSRHRTGASLAASVFAVFASIVTTPWGASVAGASAPRSWTVTQVAGHGAVPGFLDGITCTSSTTCVAVGNEVVSPNSTSALVETMTGSTWTKATLRLPASAQQAYLFRVACYRAGACVAVGYSYSTSSGGRPLMETLSRGSWSVTPTPALPSGAESGFLFDVACPAAGSCLAVGDSYTSNGIGHPWVVSLADGKWQAVSSSLLTSLRGGLNGLSCINAANCVAVGDESTSRGIKTLVVTLRGGKWSLWHSGGSGSTYANGFTSVSCRSTMACVAVGELGGPSPAISSTTAGRWTAVSGLAPSARGNAAGLWGLWCSTSTCLAVGAASSVSRSYVYNTNAGAIPDPQGVLIEGGSGGHWAPLATPSRLPKESALDDITCTPRMCLAVGMTGESPITGTPSARTLILEN